MKVESGERVEGKTKVKLQMQSMKGMRETRRDFVQRNRIKVHQQKRPSNQSKHSVQGKQPLEKKTKNQSDDITGSDTRVPREIYEN